MTETLRKRVEQYEQTYLSMPWAAEYKKLHDEDKKLSEEITFLQGLCEDKKKQIAALEEQLARKWLDSLGGVQGLLLGPSLAYQIQWLDGVGLTDSDI